VPNTRWPEDAALGVSKRLGIYVDDVYRQDAAGRVSTDRAFLLFACEVGRHFEQVVVFGRTVPSEEPADYVLPRHARLVALPYYTNLKQSSAVANAALGTAVAMWKGLARVDAVWVFGPHPFSLLLVGLARLRRKRVVLGVRQDTLEYARSRIPIGRWRREKLAVAMVLDRAYRLLGRRLPATLVGRHVAAQYGGEGPSNLVMTVSLVPERVLTPPSRRVPSQGVVRLLTVGRLDVEKNPLLIVEMLAELDRRRPGGYRLDWIGRGTLEPEVRGLAARLGVSDLLGLRGYVPLGEELFECYRDADVFVHVSYTEGVPQVLVEAMACGTPIVATAVGGVTDILDGGRAGLLVAPASREALVAAVELLVDNGELRDRLVCRGEALAAELTFEAQTERVARFIATGVQASALPAGPVDPK
jgi:glycosyltransferase involved in cell wall biosynthesis